MKLDKIIAVRNNKTIYRDGDKSVKVFNEGFSKADVLNEALNQARMEGTGLNIPKVLEVTMIDGKWAIVSEFIKGKKVLIVDDVISTGGSLLSLENLVEQAGGIIAGKMTILAEGEAADRDDIIYLEKLPLFDGQGNAL